MSWFAAVHAAGLVRSQQALPSTVPHGQKPECYRSAWLRAWTLAVLVCRSPAMSALPDMAAMSLLRLSHPAGLMVCQM